MIVCLVLQKKIIIIVIIIIIIGGRVMNHVPKGGRFACARSLTDILQSINNNPSGAEQWRQLLLFASNILTQPERAGRHRNLANLVKRRIEKSRDVANEG